ncbi:MAG: TIGR00303 family protein [Methanomicrobiales archaeon]|nr:TIGR00303 family protein [Methanomicrobiales archaeon]
MVFVTPHGLKKADNPLFVGILANTRLSTVPGVSGAGPTAKKTLLTPVLDAELITNGAITSMPVRPNTPTGCPTPATITRAVMELLDITPLFVNAGLVHTPTVPCLDLYGSPGEDPRYSDAVPGASDIFLKGETAGRLLSQYSDLLVLGECVPGGTTTALCVLRALGYPARVSSSYAENPVCIKEGIWDAVHARAGNFNPEYPLEIVRTTGDPMMAAVAGIVSGCKGNVLLAGGTQMLAVAAVLKAMGKKVPGIAMTCYVRNDPEADITSTGQAIGVEIFSVDPGFGDIGHPGLARYCIGEVKEGMGAGGAMFLASLQGFTPERIRHQIFSTVSRYH